jgi:hypothetical protein
MREFLLTTALFCIRCGSLETAPRPDPLIDVRVLPIVADTLSMFADAGHTTTVDYAVIVRDVMTENAVGRCTVFPDRTKMIEVGLWYIETQSCAWLRKLMAHEIAHCNYGYYKHVDQGDKQIMSAYQTPYDDTLALDAWDNFWLLITQLEQKTNWFGL